MEFRCRNLIIEIEGLESIFESEASWELKYELLFGSSVRDHLGNVGIDFQWHDPDCGYEEDARAFMEALSATKEDLTKAIRHYLEVRSLP